MMRLGLAIFLLSWVLPLQAAKLVAVDVGEGQAIILQQGDEAILIDTGHAGEAAHLLQRLKHYGVQRLHAIILTHLHPDHASGYFRIREAFPDVPVLESGHPLPAAVAPDMVRWVRDRLRDDPHRRILGAGDRLEWKAMQFEVLWPERFTNNNLNLHSLVLLVSLGESHLLIMGDAPQSVEHRLLDTGYLPEEIDVLVVGHHGAADSGDEAFLRHLRPDIAIISVNQGNLRGYPAAATLQRLKQYSGEVLRTDRNGDICVRLTPTRSGFAPCP